MMLVICLCRIHQDVPKRPAQKKGKKGGKVQKKPASKTADSEESDEDSEEETSLNESGEEEDSESESDSDPKKLDRAKVRKFNLVFDQLPDHVQEVWNEDLYLERGRVRVRTCSK